jgi:hypothetical protein
MLCLEAHNEPPASLLTSNWRSRNSQVSQENQSDAEDRSLLIPTIQTLLNSQGYTPQQLYGGSRVLHDCDEELRHGI